MNEKTLLKLEFDKILDRLSGFCLSSSGKKLARELKPSFKLWQVQEQLSETTEAKEMLRLHPGYPMAALNDASSAIKKINLGGILVPSELLDFAHALRVSRRMRSFILGEEKRGKKEFEETKKYPLLFGLAEGLVVLHSTESEIERCILSEDEIADDATPELNNIRKSMRAIQNRIREKLETIIRNPETQKYLQDAIVTMRGDRYVVPVKAECKGQIPGIIHDQSASGSTVFVEPIASVEMNNELKKLQAAERVEIGRILQKLTGLISQDLDQIEEALEVLVRLDFIFAKGRLSAALDAGEPIINTNGRLKLRSARHPLLSGNVVPTTLELGYNFDALIITGPNTGGKTVTLKTVGLLSIMAQSGLHTPSEEGTELSIFEQIFVDIGDEQSIEQSLSTFSSHMTNIVNILAKVDIRSLVLLDELGAGTDPTEGAALAQSILEYLQESGAKTIATTHYSELKTFAHERERVENASVEFDIESLSPTYRLLIGRPGKSNAFEIAKRLGLNSLVIERARNFISKDVKQVSELLESLEASQLSADKELEEAERLRRDAQIIQQRLAEQERKFREKEASLLEKAREEAYQILRKAREEADNLLRELRTVMQRAPVKEEISKIEAERNRLKAMQDSIQENRIKTAVEQGETLKTVKLGQTVFIPKINQKATVVTMPNAQGELTVQAGILKLTVKVDELLKAAEEKKPKGEARYASMASAKAQNMSPQLDFRGTTVDEAIELVEKYLDDAYLAGLQRVNLIHGKGTGALRAGIQDFLRKNPHVKLFRPGDAGEGGIGVTIVELK